MKEECGVFGAKSKQDVFGLIYQGLYSLQHRGQESAGIAIGNSNIKIHRAMGLVSNVFRHIRLKGHVGIGHVRYSTTGRSQLENAQPLLINYANGSFTLAHNGNLTNSAELRAILGKRGAVFSTTTDSEIIAQLIAHEHVKTGNFIEAIKRVMGVIKGSYSLVILYNRKLIAVRDPHAFRPLVLGRLKDTYVIASESCALSTLGIKLLRDIRPSEILVIDNKLKSYSGPKDRVAHCMFEYVYFARPDSILDRIPVYEVRRNLGKTLARESPVKADLVIAVPDSGINTAIGYAEESGIRYGEGLMKNRYIGRTFILPEQSQRDTEVKVKLNPITSEIKGKKLVLVDDSIVRGTTLRRIIRVLRDGGASEIHVRISCPPIRHPCFYGIDMQTAKEFIASKKTVEQIRRIIGADSLAYTSLDGLIKAIGLPKNKLCLACLTGDYPIKEKQTKLKSCSC